MRVEIEVESQEEFDLKRSQLINMLAGDRFDIDLEKSIKQISSGIKAQDEMLDHYKKKFEKVISNIKSDMENVLK